MYAMRGYGFTEDETYYEAALKEMAQLQEGISKGRQLAEKALDLKKLTGQLDTIEKAVNEYKTAMEQTKHLVEGLHTQRGALEKNAAAYMQNSADFLDGQNAAFKKDLAERQEKIEIVTRLVELGSTVRVLNFKSQSLHDYGMLQEAINKLDGVADPISKLRQVTHDSEDIRRIDSTVSAASGYQNAMREFLSEFRKGGAASNAVLETTRRKMDANAKIYVSACDEFLNGQQTKLTKDMTERNEKITLANDIIDLGNDTRVKANKSQALRDPALIMSAQQNFPKMDSKFEELRKITRLEADLKRIDAVHESAKGYSQAMATFLDEWKKLQALGDTRNTLGQTVIQACVALADAGMENTVQIADSAMSSLNASSTIMIIGLIVALVLGCSLAFFITRGITGAIARVADGLNEGSEQVASASSQVSTASQSLAEGASEQAASIEETSSSLEEMSSMTRQNADNATQADTLMKEANQVVQSANVSMGDLTHSMQEISKASEETSKIIKTIDEIAFQTNLLALNAAVEAARAGEAGAGFAVVADEVRNLAMRAADAAKNTAGLIEGTVKKVNDGGELVAKTNEAFGEVAKSTAKVGELVGEIAAASSEQAQGITQVNTAVTEVDKVTQQNAASAEESASAAEEMNAQAEQMRAYVGELIAMVGGAGSAGQTRSKAGATHKAKKISQAVHLPQKQTGKRATAAIAHQNHAAPRDPAMVIPLDNEDFEDF
jgi:methyl-accepting chemotaxis protein